MFKIFGNLKTKYNLIFLIYHLYFKNSGIPSNFGFSVPNSVRRFIKFGLVLVYFGTVRYGTVRYEKNVPGLVARMLLCYRDGR